MMQSGARSAPEKLGYLRPKSCKIIRNEAIRRAKRTGKNVFDTQKLQKPMNSLRFVAKGAAQRVPKTAPKTSQEFGSFGRAREARPGENQAAKQVVFLWRQMEQKTLQFWAQNLRINHMRVSFLLSNRWYHVVRDV